MRVFSKVIDKLPIYLLTILPPCVCKVNECFSLRVLLDTDLPSESPVSGTLSFEQFETAHFNLDLCSV